MDNKTRALRLAEVLMTPHKVQVDAIERVLDEACGDAWVLGFNTWRNFHERSEFIANSPAHHSLPALPENPYKRIPGLGQAKGEVQEGALPSVSDPSQETRGVEAQRPDGDKFGLISETQLWAQLLEVDPEHFRECNSGIEWYPDGEEDYYLGWPEMKWSALWWMLEKQITRYREFDQMNGVEDENCDEASVLDDRLDVTIPNLDPEYIIETHVMWLTTANEVSASREKQTGHGDTESGTPLKDNAELTPKQENAVQEGGQQS